jgi:hypothetical protein
MGFNRRIFWQQSGLGLWTLASFLSGSLPPNNWWRKYSETLAQSTSRKLALLIGINQYPQGNKLRGCITDVELQKELLIYRFGFQPQDILTLTDAQATRKNIETAFFEHLITQANDDDVVIFHFSGLGRQVNISQPSSSDILTTVNSLIPQDGILPLESQTITNDLILDSLFSLGRSLRTNKLTIILDTSYQNPPLSFSPKLSLRSYVQDLIPTISSDELTFSEEIKNQLKSNPKFNLNSGKIPGVILSATKEGIATEIHSNHFNAGLFTYLLTQYLWESIPSNNVWTCMGEISSGIGLFTSEREKPTLELNVKQNIFPYYLFPQPDLAGQALVKSVTKDNIANLELVGLPICVLSNYGVNSCFESQKYPLKTTTIQISDRQGIKAKGIILNPNLTVKTGDVLRESVRVFPRNLGLNIALDARLERIEKVDATSSLSSISEVKSVVNLGEDFTDCILGKIAKDTDSLANYGLFSAAGVLLPHTIGNNPNEAVSSAVRRFIPQFKTLLAAKLLHLTFNQGSSLLPVSVSLEIKTDRLKTLVNKDTFGSKEKQLIETKKNLNLEKNLDRDSLISNLPIGSEITFTVNNYSNQNIYLFLLGIDSSKKAIAYFSSENNGIMANESFTFPQKLSSLKWFVNPLKGLNELMLICSYSPFSETLNKINKLTAMKDDTEEIISLDNPVEICQALLQDLHRGSQISSDLISNLTDVYALDVNHWASFNFVYQIT